jgi:hypothetical protein
MELGWLLRIELGEGATDFWASVEEEGKGIEGRAGPKGRDGLDMADARKRIWPLPRFGILEICETTDSKGMNRVIKKDFIPNNISFNKNMQGERCMMMHKNKRINKSKKGIFLGRYNLFFDF